MRMNDFHLRSGEAGQRSQRATQQRLQRERGNQVEGYPDIGVQEENHRMGGWILIVWYHIIIL